MLRSLKLKIEQYNKILPLVDYLIPLVGDKKQVKILDIGSGPFPITGQTLDGVEIELHHADKQDFTEFWERYRTVPLFPTEIQDMERLTYGDDSFDIVHCVNALDHTLDARATIKEMIRVCKPGGWVYIDCALIQRSAQRKKHYWDAEENGDFTSDNDTFKLQDYGFAVEFIDNHGERQHNHIIARYQK